MTQRDYKLIAELLAMYRWHISEEAHWLLCANFAHVFGIRDPNGFDFERFMRTCKARYAP